MLSSIKALYLRALQLCGKLVWLGPLAVRLLVGLAFVVTGWGKLHNLDQVTGYFTDLHIPMPHANAVFVSCVELFGGAMLIAGLGTRIASLFLIGTMVVATLTAKLPEAESAIDLVSTIELTYLVVFVWLLLAGAGAASIDHLLARREAGASRAGASRAGASRAETR